MRKEKKLVNFFKKKFKRCYCYKFNREFRQQHFGHSFLQHLAVLLLGDDLDASGKSSIKMYFKMHISSRKIRLENYISKNFPKINYILNWKINNKNIWVEIHFWLIKNKVVLQETKRGLVVYPKNKSEEVERELKFYNSICQQDDLKK